MTKKRNIAIGVGVVAGLGGLAYYMSKRVDNREPLPNLEPPDGEIPDVKPPGEDNGRIQGYIKDSATGANIKDAKIYLNGEFHMNGWADGTYRTDYIPFGTHKISARADNYDTSEVTVNLQEGLINLDLLLQPLPVDQGDWSDNVTVENMSAKPSLAYFGETVHIDCYIRYWDPAPLPATITGTVRINGEEITRSFQIDIRNPTLSFPYTPTRTGEFTARAQDKSATFKVAEYAVGATYCPWGGIQMPKLIRWHGSDGQVYESNTYSGVKFRSRSLPAGVIDGRPEWEPGVKVSLWKAHKESERLNAVLRVVPMRWTGNTPYWNSRDELATDLIKGTYPTFWYDKEGEPYRSGYGVYDVAKPLAAWGSRFAWRTEGASGSYHQILGCPHCNHEVWGPLQAIGHDRLPIMRTMIEHISSKHSSYLTRPSHGELSYGVCDLCNGTGRVSAWFPCVNCGGIGERWYRHHVWGLPEF